MDEDLGQNNHGGLERPESNSQVYTEISNHERTPGFRRSTYMNPIPSEQAPRVPYSGPNDSKQAAQTNSDVTGRDPYVEMPEGVNHQPKRGGTYMNMNIERKPHNDVGDEVSPHRENVTEAAGAARVEEGRPPVPQRDIGQFMPYHRNGPDIVQEIKLPSSARDNTEKKPRACGGRINSLCVMLILVALVSGIGIGIGIGTVIPGEDTPRLKADKEKVAESVTTTSSIMTTKTTTTSTITTKSSNVATTAMTVDYETIVSGGRSFDISLKTQTQSRDDATAVCLARNQSLVRFPSAQQYTDFVSEMKSTILPYMIQQRDFWEFWIDHNTDVIPDNSLAFSQLNQNGSFCGIITTWDWRNRQDLYLVTKPCSGVEWRNFICVP